MASTRTSVRSNTNKTKTKKNRPKEVNLVTARSEVFTDATALSRDMSADNYAKTRARRRRGKILTTLLSVVLVCAVISVSTAFGFYKLVLAPRWDDMIHTDYSGNVINFDDEAFEGLFTPPADPLSPFFMLLLGVDSESEASIPRSDTIILLHIDPAQKKIAMISIPRDTRVTIPGYGLDKINHAYHWGEQEHENFLYGYRDIDERGFSLSMKTVSLFAGIDIACFAEVNFYGFVSLVDSLGGVTVDVPVPVNDPDAGPAILSPGVQTLNGEEALTFVRTRKYDSSDYQRQANQRTFLQALAKQVLSGSVDEIITSIENIASMTTSSLTVDQIINLALAFRGIQEYDIVSYTVPCYSTYIDGISYEIPYESTWRNMVAQIAAGKYPDPTDYGLDSYLLGVTPDSYQPDGTITGNDGILTSDQCASFVVDVRNGWGYPGAATAVSDMLALAGYQQGEIGNTNSAVYKETFIIYRFEADLPAANDIAMRLGFGRVIPCENNYKFNGDILVVVGENYPWAD
ncbi:MAG: LCP family protein [Coriobacteriia bacterium]|nr:LCP family protein [Coriobacteriia bacterium]MCL2137433.1 LCP family protein [Coriobacteriia bacterium]